MDELGDQLAGVGVLAEPARRTLYQYVVGEPAPVSREQAAAAIGIPVHSVKFHLDKLVAAGLLEVEYRRLTGRSGPGAGRPAKLYRRSAREVALSVPPRRYDLVGEVLAGAVERLTVAVQKLAVFTAPTIGQADANAIQKEIGALNERLCEVFPELKVEEHEHGLPVDYWETAQ